MATLTLAVADANALRFRTALGAQLNADGALATVTQAQAFFVARMKEMTIDYETGLANIQTRTTKSAEAW